MFGEIHITYEPKEDGILYHPDYSPGFKNHHIENIIKGSASEHQWMLTRRGPINSIQELHKNAIEYAYWLKNDGYQIKRIKGEISPIDYIPSKMPYSGEYKECHIKLVEDTRPEQIDMLKNDYFTPMISFSHKENNRKIPILTYRGTTSDNNFSDYISTIIYTLMRKYSIKIRKYEIETVVFDSFPQLDEKWVMSCHVK